MTREAERTHSRRAAIEAGHLIDVTALAREHRIILPTAITSLSWFTLGGMPGLMDEVPHRILAAARSQAVHSTPEMLALPTIFFAVEDDLGSIVELRLTVSSGDDGEPVATIGLAELGGTRLG